MGESFTPSTNLNTSFTPNNISVPSKIPFLNHLINLIFSYIYRDLIVLIEQLEARFYDSSLILFRSVEQFAAPKIRLKFR
jgi:hypothetical protein